MAFRSILFKISAELGGWPAALWGTGKEAALTVVLPLSPQLNETSETELFFLGLFSPTLLF